MSISSSNGNKRSYWGLGTARTIYKLIRSYDNGTVVIALDSDTVFRPLLKIPPQYKAALKLLEEQAQRCRVQFYYRIDE